MFAGRLVSCLRGVHWGGRGILPARHQQGKLFSFCNIITREFIYGLARCYDLSNGITHTLS